MAGRFSKDTAPKGSDYRDCYYGYPTKGALYLPHFTVHGGFCARRHSTRKETRAMARTLQTVTEG